MLASKGYLLSRRVSIVDLVVASTSNAVITLLIFMVVIIAVRTVTAQAAFPAVLLFLFYLLMFLLIVIGFALAASVLFVRYRDLNQVWEVVIQAGFFLAPVVYPLRIIPERFQFYLYIWPPTAILHFSRSVLVDNVVPTSRAHLCSLPRRCARWRSAPSSFDGTRRGRRSISAVAMVEVQSVTRASASRACGATPCASTCWTSFVLARPSCFRSCSRSASTCSRARRSDHGVATGAGRRRC
jgi:hypothetical protein